MPATIPETHGVCKWCGVRPTARSLATGSALLAIRPAGGEEVCYFVRRIAGGYRLTRQDGAVYELDCTFGPAAKDWLCSCPDERWNKRLGGRCKHVRAIHAALKAAGLL